MNATNIINLTDNNMKKILFLIALALCTTSMSAQNKVGSLSLKPMAGVNLSNFSNATFDIYKMKVGFTGGAELEYGVKPWLGLSLGLLYSQQGAKIDGNIGGLITDENADTWITSTEMDGKLNCSYLNLPLMANIYIPAIKGLAIKAGIQVGILASDKISSDTETGMLKMHLSSYYDLTEGVQSTARSIRNHAEMSDVCKSFDFGIPLGLSYEYKNIVLDARYYFGMTKIDKTDNPDTARNQFLSITLGYKFHL